jgi:hypothetical protein
MTYLLDFDRTLFDTDAYNRHLLTLPVCAAIRAELEAVLDTPYAELSSDDPARQAVWAKVSALIDHGALSFAPGELARYVYPDVPEFLTSMGSDAIVLTFGEPLRQRTKIESALAGIPELTIFYTGERTKAEFLRLHNEKYGAAVFVDDWAKELEEMQAAFPDFTLYEIRRNEKPADGRWPAIHSLLELPHAHD